MSWIQKLHATYGYCSGNPVLAGEENLLAPVGHTTAKAQIEVVLDEQGRFLRARVLENEDATTLIPCTEQSATRSGSKPVPHPLCDKLQYVAGDFVDYGGKVTSGFSKDPQKPYKDYVAKLSSWLSCFNHHKLEAISRYIDKKCLIRDLVNRKVLPLDENGKLHCKKPDKKERDEWLIWSVLGQTQVPGDSFIRWKIEVPGQSASGTWEDDDLINNWGKYYEQTIKRAGLCMASGKQQTPLGTLHPAKLRHAADKAKIISANDTSGYTFRGRFNCDHQACGVSYEVTQKAHSALRWLIARQGRRSGDQAHVAWAVSGKNIPQPLSGSLDWMDAAITDDEPGEQADVIPAVNVDHSRDFGRSFSSRLRKFMDGYRADISDNEDIVVIGLDAATPGRMSIIFYRELRGSEFLDRLESWHTTTAWPQRTKIEIKEEGKKKKTKYPTLVAAPAPHIIAESAYGKRVDDELRAATIERLLPCIVDGRQLPRDLVEALVRRASNRAGKEHWEWEQTLGAACALFKGFYARHTQPEMRRYYSMNLEHDCTGRDYLYGRLLAIAEHIEGHALYVAGEKRATTAERLMQRFADRPMSTWRTIETSLQPYMQRLQRSRLGYLFKMKNLLDEVFCKFNPDEYQTDNRLSGEFLLGYHCQRQELRNKAEADQQPEEQGEE